MLKVRALYKGQPGWLGYTRQYYTIQFYIVDNKVTISTRLGVVTYDSLTSFTNNWIPVYG